eukprot:TRINITY_DN21837_c0_g1_i1.p2 TRINITY_DN21837_c0_g1~~TRINITY_DN21837_c0_g1_i1.p2  ORF type:complete len:155 (+),score=20.88 TRINITY_DN21837_c0_g1_i1:121-585(+)
MEPGELEVWRLPEMGRRALVNTLVSLEVVKRFAMVLYNLNRDEAKQIILGAVTQGRKMKIPPEDLAIVLLSAYLRHARDALRQLMAEPDGDSVKIVVLVDEITRLQEILQQMGYCDHFDISAVLRDVLLAQDHGSCKRFPASWSSAASPRRRWG